MRSKLELELRTAREEHAWVKGNDTTNEDERIGLEVELENSNCQHTGLGGLESWSTDVRDRVSQLDREASATSLASREEEAIVRVLSRSPSRARALSDVFWAMVTVVMTGSSIFLVSQHMLRGV